MWSNQLLSTQLYQNHNNNYDILYHIGMCNSSHNDYYNISNVLHHSIIKDRHDTYVHACIPILCMGPLIFQVPLDVLRLEERVETEIVC